MKGCDARELHQFLENFIRKNKKNQAILTVNISANITNIGLINKMNVFDRAKISLLEKSRLKKEAVFLRSSRSSLGFIQKSKANKRIFEIKGILGWNFNKSQPATQPEQQTEANQQEPEQQDAPTAKHFNNSEKRTRTSRQKDNDAAFATLQKIQAEGRIKATDEEKSVLAKYSGLGGGLTVNGEKGSAYEYYTPPFVAEAAWGIMKEMGFSGGKVLDPCAGTGVFAATRPKGTLIEQVELDGISGAINALVNDSETSKTKISNFETIAANSDDESFDAVVANVPFGKNADRGKHFKDDPKYQNESLHGYFLLRAIDKLKPNGLGMFIIPHGVIDDKPNEKLRYTLSKKAEFIGSYRLPNKIFEQTSQADAIVDVALFKKHSTELKEKISETSAEDLRDALVLWDEFIEGKYFLKSGKKYQFGEFVSADPDKYRDNDKVLTNQSVPDMMAAMRKFGGSRIRWDVLNTAEMQVISYQEGDTQFIDGQQMTYHNGSWVIAQPIDDGVSDNLLALEKDLQNPLLAVTANIDYEQAKGFFDIMRKRGRSGSIPSWLKKLVENIERDIAPATQEQAFKVATIGLAKGQVVKEHGTGENYLKRYPILSDAIAKYSIKANATRQMFKVSVLKDACQELPLTYSKVDGFTNFWQGNIAVLGKSDSELTPRQKYSKIKYQFGDDYGYLPIEKMKAENPDFDPLNDDDYCISADGTRVMSADEFYQGTLADVLRGIDKQIKAAQSPAIIQKLMKQRQEAEKRIPRIDVDRMSFNLLSPFISDDDKLQFLREQVHPDFDFDIETDGERVIRFAGAIKTDEDRLLSRFAYYVSGTSKGGLFLQNAGKKGGEYGEGEEERLLTQLRNIADSANAKISVWAKSDPLLMERLESRVNDPEVIRFKRFEDGDKLDIEGKHPDFTPHDYQFAEIRRQADYFGGINAFGVGLGKTATSLLSVQYAHSIGVKRKTLFVVPNSVLSNWHKEAVAGKGKKGEKGYQPPVLANGQDQCLFVGMALDKNGKQTVKSSNYAKDMHKILENKHGMVFMSLEAFTRIPIKDETDEAYKMWLMGHDDTMLGSDDESLGSNKGRKQAESAENKAEKSLVTIDTRSIFPYFEDMGFDSLVFDEAHQFKNSKKLFQFKGAKFLSIAPASARGSNALIKSWYLRGLSSKGDGVLALTATPITNSPLEIYSMLSLAIGEKELSKRIGNINGSDSFMEAFTDVSVRDANDVIGRSKLMRVFSGLQNVQMLARVLHDVANIKDAKDVGLSVKLPTPNEVATQVTLDGAAMAELNEMKNIYKVCRAISLAKNLNDPKRLYDGVEYADYVMAFKPYGIIPSKNTKDFLGDVERFSSLAPVDLLGHPFNLINKMTNRVIDQDLYLGILTLTVGDSQTEKARNLVDTWNKQPLKSISEVRGANSSFTKDEDVSELSEKEKEKLHDENELIQSTMRVAVRAFISDDSKNITLDTSSYKFHDAFYEMAQKQGVILSTRVSEKVAAFIENYKKEQATPKGGSFAKQIVFADQLGMHIKIKMALTQYCGVEAGKIAIINGQAISDPADMQDAQDGFNADEEDNRYHTIIANKKAEVGINLQKRTQAIHHLMIGWTPDSLTQRNGRGVRQGNELDHVTVYQYDAKGTFDEYKRELVSKKDEWIQQLMKGDSDKVKIAEGLSDQEYDDLIMAGDDQEMIAKIKAEANERQKEKALQDAKRNQSQMLTVLKTQAKSIELFTDDKAYIDMLAKEHFSLLERAEKLKQSLTRVSKKESIERTKAFLSDTELRLANLDAMFADGVLIDGDIVLKDSRYKTPYRIEEQRSRKRYNKLEYYVKGILPNSRLDMTRNAELSKAKLALEKAKSGFLQAGEGVDGAYKEEIVGRIIDGSAVATNGVVVAKGMVGISKNGDIFIVKEKARSNPVYWLPPSTEYSVNSISDVKVYDSNSADWHDTVLVAMAKHDDMRLKTINVNDKNSKNLYSYYFPEVLPLLTESLAATFVDAHAFNYGAGSTSLKDPYFPKITGSMAEIERYGSEEVTPFMRGVFAGQADVVAYNGTQVTINNPFILDGKGGVDEQEVLNYAVAHNLKIGSGDVKWLENREVICCATIKGITSSLYSVPIFKEVTSLADSLVERAFNGDFTDVKSFDAELNALSESAFLTIFTPELYQNHFVGRFGGDKESPLTDFIRVRTEEAIAKARETIANGGVVIKWYDDLAAENSAVRNAVNDQLGIKAVENYNLFIEDDEFVGVNDGEVIIFSQFMAAKKHETIENAYYVQDWINDIINKNFNELNGVVLAKSGDTIRGLESYYSYKGRWHGAVSKAIERFNYEKAKNMTIGGKTVSEAIDLIKSVDGVEKVDISPTATYQPSNFNGSFTYKEGLHVRVWTDYNNKNAKKMSEKGSGIDGRYFAPKPAGYWLFTLDDKAQDSKGKKVASVLDFLKFYSKV